METFVITALIVLAILISLLIYFRRQLGWLIQLNILILKSLVFDKDKTEDFAHVRILGDSIAFGLGSNNSVNTFYGYFKKKYPNKVISDHSDIGSYLGQLRKSLKRSSYKQDLAVVWIGSMDIMFGLPWTYRKKLALIIEHLSPRSEHVILFSPPDTINVVFFPKLIRVIISAKSKRFHEAISAEAAQFANVSLLDYYPRGEVDDKRFYLASDMIHPNQNSYKEWFADLDKSIPKDFDFTVLADADDS